uniref:GH16 domain-containing protein n=1 Tax=Mycena chlorophos TaxID=658473 RepID=A0ABQ0LUM5_MYCCL|nr:predicted protein [Mycena chlorophos]
MPSTAALGVLAVLAVSANASLHPASKRAHHRIAVSKRTDTVAGIAYYGYQNNTENACGTYSKDTDMIIGVGPNYYGDINSVSDKCFEHITVTLASDSTKSIDVTLTDLCYECGAAENVYLSTAAFEALNDGSLDAGILEVDWSFVSSSSSSTVAPSESTPDSTSDSSVDSTTDDGPVAAITSSTKAAPTTTKAAPTKTSTTKPSTSTTASSSSGSSSDGYSLTNSLEGQNFIDFFDYSGGTGDNSGVADYVDSASGLVYTSNGQVILAVDTTGTVSNTRKAVRLTSKTTYNAKNQNLFIFDVAQIPSVCGTWPAWFNGVGADWPQAGEIDVIEGVSLYQKNIYSIHTGSGCSVSSSASSLAKVTLVESSGTNCDANVDPGACGFSDNSDTTFGPGFNKAGGGVFALKFDTSGIDFYFFQAGSVPSDITNKQPTPSSWGSPKVSISPSTCNPETYFDDLMIFLNTNLGGSFTEGVWSTDGAGGQSTSCATQTGSSTAADYVLNNGGDFGDDAQWKINGMYIYNK